MLGALLLLCLAPAQPAAAGLLTIGDGTTSIGQFNGADETPFVQALEAAPAGGVIEVLAGEYRFRRAVTIASQGVTLRGSDAARLRPAARGAVGLFRIPANHVRLTGLRIDVPAAAPQQSVVRGLGESIAVDHCRFTVGAGAPSFRFLEFGVDTAMRRGTLIESNEFWFGPDANGAIGVTLRFGLELRMADNLFRGSGGAPGACRYAVEIHAESKGTITGNAFVDLGSPASPMDAVVYSNSETEGHHFAILGNHFQRCHAAQTLHLLGGRFCAITANVFAELPAATSGAIRLQASAGGANGNSNVIAANQFQGVALGVHLSDQLWNTVTGNVFTGCLGTQVDVAASARGVLLTQNQFIASAAAPGFLPYAILVSTSTDHLIHDNAAMTAHPTFRFLKVVQSSSPDASITDNVDT